MNSAASNVQPQSLLVERYAHLLPGGYEAEIRAFWGLPATTAQEWQA